MNAPWDLPSVEVERRQQARRLRDQTRGWLEEQCFWAYPPPMVDEGDGGLELYRRYKYGGKGRGSKRWFRDKARRMAAKHMVKTFLLLKEGIPQ